MNALPPVASSRATMQAGERLAILLRGAWGHCPAPLELSLAEVAKAVPWLLKADAGGLGWWRVRQTGLRAAPAIAPLREAYRYETLLAALREEDLTRAVSRLRSCGIEPLLVKGWAAARLYPEAALRPYADIDLIVRPERFAAAEAAHREYKSGGCPVELHRGFERGLAYLGKGGLEEVSERSQLVSLNGVEVRVPSPEDHLRILAVHMLGHGAWRPLWLCDVAAAAEGRPADFDWDRCLGKDRRITDWVACAVGLAHELLGVSLEGTPMAGRAARLPHWLAPQVLRQWERGTGSSSRGPLKWARLRQLRRPAGILNELARHWRNPIEASIELGAPLNGLPRMPFQLAAALSRVPKLVARWSGLRQ
jgi:hypothetical protein